MVLAPRPIEPTATVLTTPEFPSLFSTTSTTLLYLGFLLMGLSQGLVEAVINPLTVTIYSREKTKRLNMLHAWWPGGLIIGGLLAVALTSTIQASWQLKLSLVVIPAAAYLMMALSMRYPQTEARGRERVERRDVETDRPAAVSPVLDLHVDDGGRRARSGSVVPHDHGPARTAIESFGRKRNPVSRLHGRPDVRPAHLVQRRRPPFARRHFDRQLAAGLDRFVLARQPRPGHERDDGDHRGDDLRVRKDVHLADDARIHVGAISKGRRAADLDHGRHRDARRSAWLCRSWVRKSTKSRGAEAAKRLEAARRCR